MATRSRPVDDKNGAGQEKLACQEQRDIACRLFMLFSLRKWEPNLAMAVFFLMILHMRAADTGPRGEDTKVMRRWCMAVMRDRKHERKYM